MTKHLPQWGDWHMKSYYKNLSFCDHFVYIKSYMSVLEE